METVFKYKLNPHGKVQMPVRSVVLTVAFQEHELFLWALVDPDSGTCEKTFKVYGTGHHIDDTTDLKFIGTGFTADGLVFHVFELKE